MLSQLSHILGFTLPWIFYDHFERRFISIFPYVIGYDSWILGIKHAILPKDLAHFCHGRFVSKGLHMIPTTTNKKRRKCGVKNADGIFIFSK
jgi:hypothetical protein